MQRTIGDGAFADGDFDTACRILDRYDAIDRSVTEAENAGAAAAALDRIAEQTNTGETSAITALLDALSEAARLPRTARINRVIARRYQPPVRQTTR